jgi:hypothetical protein
MSLCPSSCRLKTTAVDLLTAEGLVLIAVFLRYVIFFQIVVDIYIPKTHAGIALRHTFCDNNKLARQSAKAW